MVDAYLQVDALSSKRISRSTKLEEGKGKLYLGLGYLVNVFVQCVQVQCVHFQEILNNHLK